MGYRSVVEAVFYTRKEEEYPLLKLYVEENFPKNEELRECLKPLIKEQVVGADGKVEFHQHVGCYGYHFICEDVKWYESYTFVQEFNEFVYKFLKLLAENERARPTWAYEFVRLGEETEDTEEERSDNADFILSVRREIELNI
jgi:hypothetical protein